MSGRLGGPPNEAPMSCPITGELPHFSADVEYGYNPYNWFRTESIAWSASAGWGGLSFHGLSCSSLEGAVEHWNTLVRGVAAKIEEASR